MTININMNVCRCYLRSKNPKWYLIRLSNTNVYRQFYSLILMKMLSYSLPWVCDVLPEPTFISSIFQTTSADICKYINQISVYLQSDRIKQFYVNMWTNVFVINSSHIIILSIYPLHILCIDCEKKYFPYILHTMTIEQSTQRIEKNIDIFLQSR